MALPNPAPSHVHSRLLAGPRIWPPKPASFHLHLIPNKLYLRKRPLLMPKSSTAMKRHDRFIPVIPKKALKRVLRADLASYVTICFPTFRKHDRSICGVPPSAGTESGENFVDTSIKLCEMERKEMAKCTRRMGIHSSSSVPPVEVVE